jgi:hypothetical protein
MDGDELDYDKLATVILQFTVNGFGTDDEFDRRCRTEELLDEALKASNNGLCDGGDSGSGSMNVFLMVKDVPRAVDTILNTLRTANLLGGVTVAESIRDGDEVVGHKVWWPENFSGKFSIF